MSIHLESIKNRLAGYRGEADRWKIEHEDAMQCMDFELLLQHGVTIYDALNMIDEKARMEIYDSPDDYDPDYHKVMIGLYQWWLAPCDEILSELAKFESRFDSVDYAEQFRSAVQEVQGILTPDDEFFTGEKLAQLRDEAIDAYYRGECEEYTE